MRIRFAEFTLDVKTRQLRRGEEVLHLEPKAFALLELLLARRPEAVPKREIQAHLWPGTFVSEANLTGLVAQIRQVLGDDRQGARFVRTVHGFGYAFCGAAWSADGPGPRAACLMWEQRAIPLHPGENLLGRGPDAAVQIAARGVSRRHARIVVGEDETVIEDLGSKNGTFLREQRLAAPMTLEDGDVVRLGRQRVVYHGPGPDASTETEHD
jgi:DNA-binding winged helix-turn-helix (wHTH) protein